MRNRYGAPLLALMVTSVLALAACGNIPAPKEPSDVLPEWPDVVDCTGPLVTEAIGKVTEILLRGLSGEHTISDAAKDELLALGKTHGVDTVACLVDRVVSDWTAPGATQTPERMSAAARGRDLFESEGITVLSRPVPEASLMPAPTNDASPLYVRTDRSVIAIGEVSGCIALDRAMCIDGTLYPSAPR